MPDRLAERGVSDHRGCRSAAGNGGQYNDDVAIRCRGIEAAGEANILVIDVDIDKSTKRLGFDDSIFQARVAPIDVVEHLLQGRPISAHRLLATGERAEDR